MDDKITMKRIIIGEKRMPTKPGGGNQQQPPKEQKPPANPDPGAPENANLSTQQFIQRVAPQPGSTNSDRRDGIFR